MPSPARTMLAPDLLRELGGSVISRPCEPVILPHLRLPGAVASFTETNPTDAVVIAVWA